MPTVKSKIGNNVHLDKLVRGLGMCIKHRLYIDLPSNDKKDRAWVIADGDDTFDFTDKAVLEGSDHYNEIYFHYRNDRIDLHEGQAELIKKSIKSYLKQKKYNKVVRKDSVEEVEIAVPNDEYEESMSVAKKDLPFLVQLLEAFCG